MFFNQASVKIQVKLEEVLDLWFLLKANFRVLLCSSAQLSSIYLQGWQLGGTWEICLKFWNGRLK